MAVQLDDSVLAGQTRPPKPFAARRAAVVSFGGNAITSAGERGTLQEMERNLSSMASGVVDMIASGYPVIVTHGNGPQVGNIKLQQEAGEPKVPGMPLDVCGAMSQGQIGYLLVQSIENELSRRGLCQPVVALVTRCLVDPEDPAFAHPTKPIGPFYDEQTAMELRRTRGWTVVADSGRGFRRVVPSPVPFTILEADQIRLLAGSGALVIACGGGGVPVVRHETGRLEGLEAVIDKDLATSLLARQVRADLLILLTGVPAISVNFGTARERRLEEISLSELEEYQDQGHFPEGSMGPKIRAVVEFLHQGGREAIVTSPEMLTQALKGRAGTRVRHVAALPSALAAWP